MTTGTIGVDDGANGRVRAVNALAVLVDHAISEYQTSKAQLRAMFPGDDEMTAGLRKRVEAAEAMLALFAKALAAAAAGQGDKLAFAVDALQRAQAEAGPLADFFTDGSGRRG